MKIATFSPYQRGRSNETLITLLSHYLKSEGNRIDAIGCDGCYSVCERDAQARWQGSFNRCFSCQTEQANVLKSNDFNSIRLGSWLTPGEIEHSRFLIMESGAKELTSLTWGSKVNLFDLCAGTFESRFGTREFKLGIKEQEVFARQLLVSTLRQYIAINKIMLAGKYQLSFVPDGSDVLTCSFVCAARNSGANPVVFKYDRLDGNVFIINPVTFEIKVCEGIAASIQDVGLDISKWSSDLTLAMRDILGFLGVDNEQLALPLAN